MTAILRAQMLILEGDWNILRGQLILKRGQEPYIQLENITKGQVKLGWIGHMLCQMLISWSKDNTWMAIVLNRVQQFP